MPTPKPPKVKPPKDEREREVVPVTVRVEVKHP